jgi:thiosulfate dehydrogenase (quinone) large subunit
MNRNLRTYVTLHLRLALGSGFLSTVADRFGLWWRPGAPLVAWGNFQNFLHSTAIMNSWLPASWIPSVG